MSLLEAPKFVQGNTFLAEVQNLRVQILTVEAGKKIDWHHHSQITDTFVCLKGPLEIHVRDPERVFIVDVGQKFSVPPMTEHRVRGAEGQQCQFVIIQGIGTYDIIRGD